MTLSEPSVRGCVAILFTCTLLVACSEEGMSSLEYQGHSIQLAKTYYDYDVFKNDPDNLPPFEIPRVERLMLQAVAAHEYPDLRSMISATGRLRFPGYGSTSMPGSLPTGERYALYCVEIPARDADRCLFYVELFGRLRKLDDFVVSTAASAVRSVKATRDAVVYLNYHGQPMTTVPTASAVKGLPPETKHATLLARKSMEQISYHFVGPVTLLSLLVMLWASIRHQRRRYPGRPGIITITGISLIVASNIARAAIDLAIRDPASRAMSFGATDITATLGLLVLAVGFWGLMKTDGSDPKKS